ncbi:Phosphate regulon sensor protein PhoR [compost metagenome]
MIDPRLFELRVRTNPDLLRLAARNLMENALHHSPAGGKVHCSLERDDGGVTIAIDDDGPGIPPEEMPHVTERFFRGRFKAAIGSGLGLSIAELALDQAGAALALQNRAEGGLSARIVLPKDLIV